MTILISTRFHRGAHSSFADGSVDRRTCLDRLLAGIAAGVILSGGLAASAHAQPTYPYLDDAERSTVPPPSRVNRPWPRLNLTETPSLNGTNEQFSKYDVISGKGHNLERMAEIQDVNPDVMFLRYFSPRAYQSANAPYCYQGGSLPFGTTGEATQGCAMFAGHWLYQAGTTLARPVGAADTIAYVDDASRLTPDQYVVLYNPPAGSFAQAEHAKVVAVGCIPKV